MTTQKDIVRILDQSASRAGEFGATSKQTWFLAGLMLRIGDDGQDFLLGALPLSKKLASEMIDAILATTKEAA
jgi:hypothetical protein